MSLFLTHRPTVARRQATSARPGSGQSAHSSAVKKEGKGGFEHWSSRWEGWDIPLSYNMVWVLLMYMVPFISPLKLFIILEIRNYFKFYMKTLETQNTNIIHDEMIHDIAFVTNIKFFLYFELK
jgi:hypothetical protein